MHEFFSFFINKIPRSTSTLQTIFVFLRHLLHSHLILRTITLQKKEQAKETPQHKANTYTYQTHSRQTSLQMTLGSWPRTKQLHFDILRHRRLFRFHILLRSTLQSTRKPPKGLDILDKFTISKWKNRLGAFVCFHAPLSTLAAAIYYS